MLLDNLTRLDALTVANSWENVAEDTAVAADHGILVKAASAVGCAAAALIVMIDKETDSEDNCIDAEVWRA